ncbi:MAG TPA: hypothetical protein GXZ65_02315 [Clostridiales bacterium]|jgi:hypothetical protein|nr:hypothetical protein [Clostridiales bacterium]
MPMNNNGRLGYLIMQDLGQLPPSHSSPEVIASYERFGKRIHWVDGNNIPGSFQMNTSWWFKANRESILSNPKSQVGKPHSHGFPEILGFYGSDPNNPYDLGGEVELYLDGEPYILTKSTMVFIPPNLPHCPLLVNRVDRPIFHFSVVMNGEYTFERDDE